jgi:glycosyltransferase involved in cell wall biosynthesis
LKICIDIQSAIAQGAGVGRYTKVLVENLIKSGHADKLKLFYFDFKKLGCSFASDENLELKPITYIPGRFVQKAWKTINYPPFDFFAGKADVYHFPNFIIPPIADKKGKKIVSIHDTSFIRFPEFTEEKNLKYITKKIKQTVEQADKIITISHFSASEIHTLLNVPEHKIGVTHLGISESFKPEDKTEAFEKVKQKTVITEPYILTLGTVEPRKNLLLAIDMFEKMNHFEGNLVIAGMLGWKYETIMDRIKESPKSKKIIYLNYVPDGLLSSLYSAASLYIIPSHYEGFGFPPVEAMACGTPVLSSKGGSLPEILGNAAEYAEFDAPDQWADKAEQIINNQSIQNDLITKGIKQASKYRWNKTADETWKIYFESINN